MKQNFKTSVDFVILDEGGDKFTDRAGDPGGPTKYGITLRTLKHWRNDNSLTSDDVRNLTREEAVAIYHALYWQACRCDELPSGVDYVVFGSSVMSGQGDAVRWLQAAVHVAQDGRIGPNTLAAARKSDSTETIAEMIDGRREYYHGLPHAAENPGWFSRLDRVERRAVKMSEEVPSRKSPVQSRTLQATAAMGVGQAATAVHAVQSLDQYSQYIVLGVAGFSALLLIYIFRSRLRKWADGIT